MNTFFGRLIILVITLTIIASLNNILLTGESQQGVSKESFLRYNDTIYGTSINYPSTWVTQELGSEFLLSVLENMSSSEQKGINQSNDIASKVSDILEAFGLKDVSDVLGLKPTERSEFFQKMSQALNEGSVQMVVAIVSPPEDELDVVYENMNIVVENISTLSPISLTDYVDANIEGMKVGYLDFKVLEPMKEITVDGKPAISFVYTGTIGGTEQQKSLQVYTIRGDMGYILTFGATPGTYSTYLPTFQKMLESFKVSS